MNVSDKMSPHRKDIIFKREEFSSGGKASQRNDLMFILMAGLPSLLYIQSTFAVSQNSTVPAGFSNLGFSDHFRFNDQKLAGFGRPIYI